MTNFTHHANANDETLGSPHGHHLGTSQASSSNSSTASSSKSGTSHCAHMAKQSKPIKEEVIDVEEEWDY